MPTQKVEQKDVRSRGQQQFSDQLLAHLGAALGFGAPQGRQGTGIGLIDSTLNDMFPNLNITQGGAGVGTSQFGPGGVAGRIDRLANPEAAALGQLSPALLSVVGDTGQGAFEQFMGSIQPAFDRNLQFALGELGAAAPSVSSSAFGLQGIDAATRAQQDFNTFAQQSRLAFLQPSLQAAELLGSLAGGAGGAIRGQEELFQQTLANLFGIGTQAAFTPTQQAVKKDTTFGSLLKAGTAIGGAAIGAG